MKFQSIPLLLAIMALCSACHMQPWGGFPRHINPELVWPTAPEQPKVAFVMEIRDHTDLFEEGGGWQTLKSWIAGQPDSTLVRPYALALHPVGGLLIADPGRQVVHFYDWSRRRYISIGPERTGGLPSPVGVVALPDGRILVSDSRLGSIESFDTDGKFLGPFCNGDLFQRPAGLAIDPARQQLYVVDVIAHRIGVLDWNGRLLRWIGERGDNPGQFNFPTHLALTPDGLPAISDSMNFRIQLVQPDGTPVRTVGQLGDAPGSFAQPKGVACDAQGRRIVVEGRHDAIQFFSPKGELLLSLGSPGSQPGQFWLPAGLCMDWMDGLLFVADSYNRRVQVFRLLESAPPLNASVNRTNGSM